MPKFTYEEQKKLTELLDMMKEAKEGIDENGNKIIVVDPNHWITLEHSLRMMRNHQHI